MTLSYKLLVFVYLSILGTALYGTFIQTACLCVSQHSGDCLIWHFHTNCLSLCISAFWGLPYMAISYKLLVSVYLSILGTLCEKANIVTMKFDDTDYDTASITKYNGHDDFEYTWNITSVKRTKQSESQSIMDHDTSLHVEYTGIS